MSEVVLKNLKKVYDNKVTAVHDVNLEIKDKEFIVLVGPSGCGKSTIGNLLLRFYDVVGGEIRVDGQDIRRFTQESYRSNIGVVLQEPFLFSGTIHENIAYARPTATMEEVREAARTAMCDHFICQLPDGYDTVLSESGANMSEGQRQLLAIARAVLAQSPVLILDEATSNVDTRTEMRIQAALTNLMKNRTAIIIAHRLSTIRDADVIVVLAGGSIVEAGDHETLLSQKGEYYKLYQRQFAGIQT